MDELLKEIEVIHSRLKDYCYWKRFHQASAPEGAIQFRFTELVNSLDRLGEIVVELKIAEGVADA